jgi:3-dehydroquinate synthase II
MKQFWLELSEVESEDEILRIVAEARPDVVLLSKPIGGMSAKVASRHEGADILVTSDPEEAKRRRDGTAVAIEIIMRDRNDQEKVSKSLLLKPDYLLVDCPDWKIIPIENLIAESRGRSRLLAKTRSTQESKTLLSVLELGVDGICLTNTRPEEIRGTHELFHAQAPDVPLSAAKVTSIRPIGTGARVCVDTCEILEPGEGLLTGSSSQALFLVEGEVYLNDHVNPRPFRVNAGPVSLYVFAQDGKTRYLSELEAGEPILLVNKQGRTRNVDIARVKIERRPMVLVEASVASRSVKTIVQNAETVRLVTNEGSKSVRDIKPGDELLVRYEEGGRHFGTRVADEMIIER